jgi:hypothetical protein
VDDGPRPEQLLTLSSAARRISDLVAAAGQPVQYEVLRHLLRVSEETMVEALEEAVHVRLVRRTESPVAYEPYSERVRAEVREAMGEERLARLRGQIARASERVFE